MNQKNKVTKKVDRTSVANFLYEVGMLSKTPRSGFSFLGSGEQSVAEHLNRVAFIGYVLAMLEGDVDTGEVVMLCMFHDLGEARISDLNYVHQKYVRADEERAVNDLASTLEFGDDIKRMVKSMKEQIKKEAIIMKDADQLEFILSLKEQMDIGNARAKTWIPNAVKRLKTKIAKDLAKVIIKTPSDNWWYANKSDTWWVKRNKESIKGKI